MTVINSNVAALRAQSGSRVANKMLETAMERLSTGKRINSAKDDAAGLAIATRMTSQVRGLAVSIRNANDGISLAQTAEGAMGEVTNMLQRMKELATQSANGTLGSNERAALQVETDQLVEQINSISKTTSFNGLTLLDGRNASLKLQTGPSAGDQISLSLTSVKASDLGLTGAAAGQVVTGRVAGAVAIDPADLQFNGVNVYAAAGTPADAKEFAAAVNVSSIRTGVSATASNNYTSAALGTGSFASGTINGKAIGAAASAAELVDKINSNSFGVSAALNDDGSITLSNKDGSDIVTTGGAFGATTSAGFVSLKSNDGSAFTIAGATPELASLGLNATDGVAFTGTIVTVNTALAAGDVLINGVDVGVVAANAGSATLQAADYVTKINSLTSKTGVIATNNAGVITLASTTGAAVRVEGAAASKIGFRNQGGSDKMSYDLDISSQSAATQAMKLIDVALDKVSAKRGDLGAIQNRLEVTVSNLSTSSTNLIDARSRTEDADFSAETTNLAKAQILSQAATAMLAQANQNAQGVLSLLR